jgi:hypothetical protein
MKRKETISDLMEKIRILDERLKAVEKEQRTIREDILSGSPQERLQKRMLENTEKRKEEFKKKLDSRIKIEI